MGDALCDQLFFAEGVKTAGEIRGGVNLRNPVPDHRYIQSTG